MTPSWYLEPDILSPDPPRNSLKRDETVGPTVATSRYLRRGSVGSLSCSVIKEQLLFKSELSKLQPTMTTLRTAPPTYNLWNGSTVSREERVESETLELSDRLGVRLHNRDPGSDCLKSKNPRP